VESTCSAALGPRGGGGCGESAACLEARFDLVHVADSLIKLHGLLRLRAVASAQVQGEQRRAASAHPASGPRVRRAAQLAFERSARCLGAHAARARSGKRAPHAASAHAAHLGRLQLLLGELNLIALVCCASPPSAHAA
jgi:hypothetical protein